jgi:hypothetical protein
MTMDELILQRRKARQEKNYAEADRLRDLLVANGVIIKDNPDGSSDYSVKPTPIPTEKKEIESHYFLSRYAEFKMRVWHKLTWRISVSWIRIKYYLRAKLNNGKPFWLEQLFY